MGKIKSLFCILFLAVSSHAATLTCTFGPAPDYQCTSFNLSDITQVNEAITVPGAPMTPYIDNMTTSMQLYPPTYFTSIQQFPKKFFEMFPNLFYLTIYEISMTELATDSFNNCKRLDSLSFTSTNFGNIRAGFARTCNLIQSFYIYNSNFLSLDENAFVGMESVQFLGLRNNSITCIPRKLLQPFKKLSSLDLDLNKITAIHSQLFADFRRLNHIDLTDNLIGYIPNLNLTQTGVDFENVRLNIWLQNNPIKAINSLFMTSLFNERPTNTTAILYFGSNSPESIETCVDPNLKDSINFPGNLFQIGSASYWILQDAFYKNSTTCYSSFTAEMGSDSLVTCGNTLTTTVTPTLRPKGSSSSESRSRSSSAGSKNKGPKPIKGKNKPFRFNKRH